MWTQKWGSQHKISPPPHWGCPGRGRTTFGCTATAPAVAADLVGVTPDFIAQSSRWEVEVKAVAGSFHRALVIPCGEDGRPVATGSRTISAHQPHKSISTNTSTPPPPLPLSLHPSPHLRTSSSPCASCSCKCRRCGVFPPDLTVLLHRGTPRTRSAPFLVNLRGQGREGASLSGISAAIALMESRAGRWGRCLITPCDQNS